MAFHTERTDLATHALKMKRPPTLCRCARRAALRVSTCMACSVASARHVHGMCKAYGMHMRTTMRMPMLRLSIVQDVTCACT